jgi:hypothetical protein
VAGLCSSITVWTDLSTLCLSVEPLPILLYLSPTCCTHRPDHVLNIIITQLALLIKSSRWRNRNSEIMICFSFSFWNTCQTQWLLFTVISQPEWAHPRNLTGSDGRLKKDKRQKTNMQKAGVRWVGCSGGDTQQQHPPPACLLYTVANKEVQQQFLRGHDIVVIGNRRNLRLLLSGRKHLRKSSCAAFRPCLFLQLGLCQLSLQVIWHSCAYVKFSEASHSLLPTSPPFYIS